MTQSGEARDDLTPLRELLDRIGDKWTVVVISALAAGPLRFSDLARTVSGVSQKVLTQTLRAMQRDGLVTRLSYPEVPPRVTYELTDVARSLLGLLSELDRWATEHVDELLQAREHAASATARGSTRR